MTDRGSAFVEVTSPGWAFWRAAVDTGVGVIVGSLYAFLGVLVMGIVGEEALSALYRQIDLDPVFRASTGVMLLAWAVLAITVPFLSAAERVAALRAVETSARTHPDMPPPPQLRRRLAVPPRTFLKHVGITLSWCLGVLAALCLIMILVTEEFREDLVMWAVLAGMVLAVVAATVLTSAAERGVEREEPRVKGLNALWRRLVPQADAADRRRRDAAPEASVPRWLTVPSARMLSRISGILLAATGIALASFMLSIFLRQQCRTCEPITWGEPVEDVIDVLSLASGAAIALCAAVGAVAWFGGVVLQVVREAALAAWAAQATPRRIDPAVIAPLLTGRRALVRLQYGLCTAGAASVILAVGVVWAGSALFAPGPVIAAGATLIAVGFLLGWGDAGRSARERQRIRDALLPGDAGAELGDEATPGVPRAKRR